MSFKKLRILSMALLASISFHSVTHAEQNLTDYVIQEGDNLWRLCQQFKQEPKSCWSSLADINQISNPNALRPQRTVKLPSSWFALPTATASVKYVKGNVAHYPFDKATNASSQNPQRLETSTVLNQGDRILTTAGSHTTIIFADQTEMAVNSNSDLTLDLLTHVEVTDQTSDAEAGTIPQEQSKSHTQSRVLLRRGKVTSLVNPNKRRSEFEIKTPFSVAAVRGTQFRVSVGEETASSEVLEGLVDVRAEGEKIALNQGYGSVVKEGEAPGQPIQLLDGPIFKTVKDLKEPDAAKIKWKKLAGAELYEIDLLKKNGYNYEMLSSFKTSENVYRSIKLSEGDYEIKVRAIDKNLLSGFNSSERFEVGALQAKEKACSYIQRKRLERHCR